MAYSFLVGTFARGAGGATTPGVDTTGASIIFATTSSSQAAADPVVTDSKVGNTWTKLTTKTSGVVKSILWYCKDPAQVGAAHTFTVTGGTFAGLIVRAYSGSKASTPFDAENGAVTASGTSLATGSVTPAEDNEIIVVGWAANAGATAGLAIGGGFTLSGVDFYSDGANYFGTGMAVLIQTTGAAANPTVSWTGAADAAVTIAAFKAAAGSTLPALDASSLRRSSLADHAYVARR